MNKPGVVRVTESMTIAVEHAAREQRRVRVWFGSCPICDYLGEPEEADRYELAMRRRFTGLRITNESIDPEGR